VAEYFLEMPGTLLSGKFSQALNYYGYMCTPTLHPPGESPCHDEQAVGTENAAYLDSLSGWVLSTQTSRAKRSTFEGDRAKR